MHRTDPTERQLDMIIAWRTRRLRRAGFERKQAETLASDHRIDLHALLQLVDRDCPPELAARILAPLEQDGELS